MIEDLRNKVILITGASTGIGAAAARAFGACGAGVVVHYNQSADAARQVASDIEASGGKAVTVQADVTVTAQIGRLVRQATEALGRIDVLINNAGDLVGRFPLTEITDEAFDRVLNLNARSMVMACREVVPLMRKQGGGNIINVSSVAARIGGSTGAVLYAGAKGFVSTATRALARELAADRIRVNAVAPGVIVTPLQERHTSAELLESFRRSVPMQRLGSADECAGAFLYLASDRLSGYVTGQILEVNGGQLMP